MCNERKSVMLNNDLNSCQAPEESATTIWSAFCHLSALTGLLLPFLVPLGSMILAPALIWWIKRNLSTEVRHHSRNAVNFQLSATLLLLAAMALSTTAIGTTPFLLILFTDITLVLIAGVRAYHRLPYNYPLMIHWIK